MPCPVRQEVARVCDLVHSLPAARLLGRGHPAICGETGEPGSHEPDRRSPHLQDCRLRARQCPEAGARPPRRFLFPGHRRVRPMGAPCRASAPRRVGGDGRIGRRSRPARPRCARTQWVCARDESCLPAVARPGRAAPITGGKGMFDLHSVSNQPIPRIEVEDYIEMGRLVAEWATDPDSRPADLAALKEQLAGVAVLPERVRTVEFVQGTLDHLVIRLPVKELVEDTLERMLRPRGQSELPGSAVLRRPLPPGLRAGDEPARHAARAGRRPDHCPVPLTDRRRHWAPAASRASGLLPP